MSNAQISRTPREELSALTVALRAVWSGKGREVIPAADFLSLVRMDCIGFEDLVPGLPALIWMRDEGWEFWGELTGEVV